MPLAHGRRLGPYEIVAPLGSGGMGEVYRARDQRLGREVAVKVLADAISRDEAARARFEREVRAVAALSHPNVLAIHDLGRDGEIDFAVMELLEGETLRERLDRGPIPREKAVAIAAEIAAGLAAVHERGIAHRDLKPENLFLTRAGAKILDFGLATEAAPTPANDTRSPTAARLTTAGAVVGTVGYMAPEQVRGEPADHRSDVFSFGCILYEMLSGRRAFRRDTGAEIMTAILREEPEPLSGLEPAVPASLARLVAHCLEKDPTRRFQSMRDVGYSLETAVQAPPPATAATAGEPPPLRRSPGRLVWFAAGAVAVVLAWVVAAWRSGGPMLPRFEKLTFQRGTIYSARLAPDGQTVVYGASWRGAGLQLFSKRLDAPESRRMGLAADILAISPSGEMALSLDRHTVVSLLSVGRLARAPLGGGAPRELLDGVVDADWSPDGNRLAVTREVAGEARLEYPVGTVLDRAGGYLSTPRVSPDGTKVAFIKHQVKGDDRGSVAIVDLSGHVTIVSRDLPSVTGLAWSPGGREVWYSGWVPPGGYALEAVTPGGRTRTIFRSGVRMRLLDVRGRRALIGHENAMAGASGLLEGDDRERDLSFLDGTCATDLTTDGEMMLFSEAWIGGGPGYSFFVRRSSADEPVRLGEGWGSDLSADGQWALSYPVDPPMRLVFTPTGPGQEHSIDLPDFEAVGGAAWLPGEKRVLVWASRPGEAFRGYVVALPDGKPRPVTPPGVNAPLFSNASHGLSPDGSLVAATGGGRGLGLYPVDGGEPRSVPGALATDVPVAWTDGGRSLLVRAQGEIPSRVYSLDVQSGRRALWKTLMPADPAGVQEILGVVCTPDRQFYAYTYLRLLTELYVVEGLE